MWSAWRSKGSGKRGASAVLEGCSRHQCSCRCPYQTWLDGTYALLTSCYAAFVKKLELELSDATFRKLEALRRAKKLSRAELLAEAIGQAADIFDAERAMLRTTAKGRRMTGEEADRLATELVREARRARRQ